MVQWGCRGRWNEYSWNPFAVSCVKFSLTQEHLWWKTSIFEGLQQFNDWPLWILKHQMWTKRPSQYMSDLHYAWHQSSIAPFSVRIPFYQTWFQACYEFSSVEFSKRWQFERRWVLCLFIILPLMEYHSLADGTSRSMLSAANKEIVYAISHSLL